MPEKTWELPEICTLASRSSALIGLVATILLTGSDMENPRWGRSKTLEGTTLDTDFLNIDAHRRRQQRGSQMDGQLPQKGR